MAVTVRGHPAVASATVTNVNIAYPANIASGDIGMLAVIWNPTLGALADPSGWTPVDYRVMTSSSRLNLFKKTCTGSETGNLNVSVGAGGDQKLAVSMVVIGGVNDFGTQYAFGSAGASTTTTLATPTVSVSKDKHITVGFYGQRSSAPSTDFTQPSGWTAGQEAHGTSGGACEIMSGYLTTSDEDGTIGADVWTRNTTGSVNKGAVTLALKVTGSTVTNDIQFFRWNGTTEDLVSDVYYWNGSTAVLASEFERYVV